MYSDITGNKHIVANYYLINQIKFPQLEHYQT